MCSCAKPSAGNTGTRSATGIGTGPCKADLPYEQPSVIRTAHYEYVLNIAPATKQKYTYITDDSARSMVLAVLTQRLST